MSKQPPKRYLETIEEEEKIDGVSVVTAAVKLTASLGMLVLELTESRKMSAGGSQLPIQKDNKNADLSGASTTIGSSLSSLPCSGADTVTADCDFMETDKDKPKENEAGGGSQEVEGPSES